MTKIVTRRWVNVVAIAIHVMTPLTAIAEPVAQLPEPELNADSWVMIEIWPDVRDITLSAYFLDFSDEKNRNLCEVTKRVFDRDSESRAKAAGKKFSSYRLCLSVGEARSRGYFQSP